MLHYLRIAVTALSLTACVLLIALWVRSYRWVDMVSGPRLGSRIVAVGSTPGVFCFTSFSTHNWWMSPWDKRSFDAVNWWKIMVADGTQSLMWGKAYTSRMWGKFEYDIAPATIYIPYWFGVLISASVATITSIPWSKRFSLRTLLIATTLVAVGLAIIVIAG
jgi:hypothetical protein